MWILTICVNRHAQIACVLETYLSGGARRDVHFQGAGDGRGERVVRVDRDVGAPDRAVGRQARVVALEAVVAEQLAVDAAIACELGGGGEWSERVRKGSR